MTGTDGFASLPFPSQGTYTCVHGILTINNAAQVKLAKRAAASFAAQTYPSKVLTVVAPFPIEGLPPDAALIEHEPRPHRVLFDVGRSSVPHNRIVCWWPYDHFSPLSRIERQMAGQRAGCAVALDAMLLYDALNNNALVVSSRNGFSATALFPRNVPLAQADDGDVQPLPVTPFHVLVARDGVPHWMPPIRFRDSANNYPETWFLPPGAASGTKDLWLVGGSVKTYLTQTLEKYGMRAAALAGERRPAAVEASP